MKRRAPPRITRRNGSYRQSFGIENFNRKARIAPIMSFADDNDFAEELPRNGRLKVAVSRTFSPNVPFELEEGKFSYEDAPNPVNQTGPLLRDNVPVVTSNDFESFMAAFNKRCNFMQAGSEDDVADDVFSEAIDTIRSLRPSGIRLFGDSEWEEEEQDVARWLDKFDDRKRERMVKATEHLPFADASYLGTKDLSVKLEVLLKRYDPDWAPRVIYAGNDAFNRVTGPAMMVAMERLLALTSSVHLGPVKVKLAYKTNDVDLVTFLDDDQHPHAYEGDFSRNDREQRSRVASIIDAWFDVLRMPTWLRTLVLEMEQFTVQNKRFGARGFLKYQLPTGTTLTTFRNSCYNATMVSVACARQNMVSIKACILGDDILFVSSLPFCISKWKQTVDRFKMVLKGKMVKLNGDATLLSRRLIIFGDEVKCMLPLIGKALARFNARASMNSAVSDSQYMAGKALSYAYEFRHVPFMRDFFMRRYHMEDSSFITLDDLTWFTRSSGMNVPQIIDAVRNETVLVNDEVFREWLMDTYDIGLTDLAEICESVIPCNVMEFVHHPEVDCLAIDW
jgi:hypothetical protein